MDTQTLYYGIYKSSKDGTTISFASLGQKSVGFPARVDYKGTRFNFENSFTVSSPSQENQFREYCKLQNIETDVKIY